MEARSLLTTPIESGLNNGFAAVIERFTQIKAASALKKLMQSARDGHLCLPLSHLDAAEHNSLLQAQNQFGEFLKIAQDNLYLQKNFLIESIIKEELRRLSQPTEHREHNSSAIPLNEAQKNAVALCLRNRLVFLHGGPGTGKTYTAAAIISAFDPHREKRVALVAPTGRAADHLQQSIYSRCGVRYPSSTLHKLLKIGAHPPWPSAKSALSLDLLVVDEASMIEAPLFATLLHAIPYGSTTVIMGDPYQLNPVGIGSIFHDLIHSEDREISIASLHSSMRTDRPHLLRAASQILHAEFPDLPLYPPSHVADIFRETTRLHTSFFDPEEALAKVMSHRVLNCLRAGPLGADAWNKEALLHTITTTSKGEWWWAPIMITKNDEARGLSNGSLGIYMEKKDDPESGKAYFAQKTHALPFYELPTFDWSFCCSVHKSQGSEYEKVTVIIPPGSEYFGREILYTAVTRAQREVELIGTSETLHALLMRSSIKISGLS
jgi:exodeoxyribonuclease V alpha subunit